MPNDQILTLVSEEVIRSAFALLTALLIEVMHVIVSDIKKIVLMGNFPKLAW